MIVLDTHAWVWFLSDPERLSGRAREVISAARESAEILVSSISAWEVALLVRRKRLGLSLDVADWIARAEALPFLRFIPVDNGIAIGSVLLPPPIHADPADRIIIATAISLRSPVVTKDAKIRRYRHVETIW
ncbi:MAG: type II toxin-antitoxin system VapC family toxin [Planctomycetes bacterium]|nr:type II toxin-antitoxin system VapC family toxin [Planctomycetota bacterium]